MSDEQLAEKVVALITLANESAKAQALREAAAFVRGQTTGARWDYVLNAIGQRLDDKADELEGKK